MKLHNVQTRRRPLRDEQCMLVQLHRQALSYFIDNQLPHGLILDRQRNHGRRSFTGLCSTSATGMGLIALALAAQPHHGLLTPSQARRRVRKALKTALALPQVHGMMAHFLDARTLKTVGSDAVSTIDSSWLIAGALVAAEMLDDCQLKALAGELFERVDWRFWVDEQGLISHGLDAAGNKLPGVWDRFNAETAFMYVLGMGAKRGREVKSASWQALKPFDGTLAGCHVISADLGLFVFQYSLCLLEGDRLPASNGWNLGSTCREAMLAHQRFCASLASQFRTYADYWGLSAGDGPLANSTAQTLQMNGGDYRAYSPAGPIDGTAHLTATLACLPEWPQLVAGNVEKAEHDPVWRQAHGRYGFSNFNVDRNWLSRDVVGIDIGAAAMALENGLHGNTVRRAFQRLPVIRLALRRLRA